ncbi:hypothetical protein E2P86_14545 [Sphingobacterium psychroaquaticum]|uniref:hypothetical protein n=1 Tax=Sphingobacterium psychroaquaticum TaxID=561061 RepID=UPI00106B37CB|nr:hypothetical protein [Sphingobacterium psychroaquaticum]QBQ42298.1 hypothetical protein E2P86_14545 [Sphingobacterium psychroaquaticum]
MRQETYSWKNNIWGTRINLYQDKTLLGKMKNFTFKPTSEVILGDEKYHFETKGLFEQYTRIVDKEGRIVGDIDYGAWSNKATVQLFDKKYFWKADDWMRLRWRLVDDKGVALDIQSSYAGKGEIRSEGGSELLLMTGIFLQNYFMSYGSVMLMLLLVLLCV